MVEIEFKKLVPNRNNYRKYTNKTELENLKKSIEKNGLIQPLVVRPIEDGKYEIVAGMNRYTCLKALGIEKVECSVKNVDEDEAIKLSLIENIQRESLNPIDEANGFFVRLKSLILKGYGKRVKLQQYQDEIRNEIPKIFGFSNDHPLIKQLSDEIGWNPKTITNRLSVLNLPDLIQEEIAESKIDLSMGYEISRLKQIKDKKLSQEKMMEVYEKLKKHDYNLSQLKQVVKMTLQSEFDNLTLTEEQQQKRILTLEGEMENLEIDVSLKINDVDSLLEKTLGFIREKNENSRVLSKVSRLFRRIRFSLENRLMMSNEVQIERIEKLFFTKDLEKTFLSLKNTKNLQTESLNVMKSEDNCRCPVCKREVDLDKIKKMLVSLSQEIKTLENEIDGRKESLEKFNDTIRRSKILREYIDKKKERINQLENSIKKIRGEIDVAS